MVGYRISPKFLAIIAEEGLVIHDPNFHHYSSGWNLCVRPDTGHNWGAISFSSAAYAAAGAACGTAI
jgi:hypothetical protein